MNGDAVELSPLGHTWIFDLDGTLLKHNGYIVDGVDSILPDVKSFFQNLPEADMVILVTSRAEERASETIDYLKKNGIRFDHIIFDAPYGERILVNDDKPSGLATSIAVRLHRDRFDIPSFSINPNL